MEILDDGVPRDIATFAPSLAHRVGFREWWERAARRGASPSTALAFNLVTFSADLRWCLPSVTCPTLSVARTDSYGNLVEHGRYLAQHIDGATLGHRARDRSAPVGGRVRRAGRRNRGVHHRHPQHALGDTPALHRPLHRHRGLHGAGGRAR